MEKLIFKLVDQMKQLEAPEAHFTANNIKHTKGLTAVVSVYDQQKPAHLVLEELYEWAEDNNIEVKNLIDKFSKDMGWNEENPV
ncbi:hypothetical protein FKN04_13045 [Bacillus glycinifermentans]|uniref:hypothetical protein n=1 Tax=Bacillus TaxID=1386 RepID=UPI0015835252|nr:MULTISPECIES: hypothetical protein [Bacillus]NUJ17503.1 hypothetical protein [Bacillus glycinifermentans]GIN67093.1 hypothetical protein J41TS2_25140 [Bacillus sonorensis]